MFYYITVIRLLTLYILLFYVCYIFSVLCVHVLLGQLSVLVFAVMLEFLLYICTFLLFFIQQN